MFLNFDNFAEPQTIFEYEKQITNEVFSFLEFQDITKLASFVQKLYLMLLLIKIAKVVLNGIGIQLNALFKSIAVHLVEKSCEKHAINTKLLAMYSKLNPLQNGLVLCLAVKNSLDLQCIGLPAHILAFFDNGWNGFG